MKLIDRYVSEVGKRLLALQGREDIEKELRSTLEDMLEERAAKAGKPADEALEIELLKEYGSPDSVATTYNPHPYLIGPQLFPIFLKILKIVFFSITLGLTVVMAIQLATQTPLMGSDVTNLVGNWLSKLFSTAVAAFGYVVLTFAILERTVPDLGISKEDFEDQWEPASLVNEPEPDAVKRVDLIFEIVFTFIGLAIINGIFDIPIFSATFRQFVPWINTVFIIEILLDIYLLRKAVWDTATRVVKIVMETGTIVLAVIMLQTPNLLMIPSEALENIPETSSIGIEGFIQISNWSITIVLAFVLVMASVELIKAGIGLFRSYTRK